MRWFKDLPIWKKVLALAWIAAIALGVVGFTGYYYMARMDEQAKEMYAEHLLPVEWLNVTREHFRAVEADIWKLTLPVDKAEEQRLVSDIRRRGQEANTLLEQYGKVYLEPEEKDKLTKLMAAIEGYRSERETAVELALAGDKRRAFEVFNFASVKIAVITDLLEDLAATTKKHADALAVEIDEEARLATRVTIAVAAAAVLLCVVIGTAIARTIARSLSQLQLLMAQAGAGDLTVHGDIASRDEIGELTASFNLMLRRQAEVIALVRKSAVEQAAASEEMAASCEEVNATTEEVARSMAHVTETAAQGNITLVEASEALVHLSSLIQIAKSKSAAAADKSQKTMAEAASGQTTVREAVACMGVVSGKTKDTEEIIAALNSYSTQIALITDTITGIANQTNLLALNAAIEAARAGEAGRGFAVVADEVRKLAEQSNQGAGEVAALVQKITESTQHAVTAMQQNNSEVVRGIEAVNKAGAALDGIVAAVDGTVGDIGGVLDVTNEEVASSDKVVDLINRLANVIETTSSEAQEVSAATEETTAAMETVAASSEQGSAMANSLKTMVEVFKLPAAGQLDAAGILERAKSDHLLWKMRVVNMLRGIETLTEKELTSHTDCRLGKWYFNPDNPLRNDSDFRAINDPHNQVHEYARQAVLAYQAGDRKKAEKYSGLLGRSSGKVIVLLDRLIRKAGKEGGKAN